MLGLTPDSLYHTLPSLVMAIPYGPESDPPGEGHILTAPVDGFSRPRFPLLKSVK